MSGIPKYGNVTLERGVLEEADNPHIEPEEPEGEGFVERLSRFFRSLF